MFKHAYRSISAFVLFFAVGFDVAYAQDEEEDSIISIPDGGRRMRLGEFYDARIDQVIPGRLWEMDTDLVKRFTYVTPSSSSSIDFSASDTLSSRIDLMDLDIRAAFKMVKGTVTATIDGSFKYVKDTRSSDRSIKYAIGYHTRTNRETLDVFNGEMLSNVNTRIFDPSDNKQIATHFVSSIVWGADVYVSFESFYKDLVEKKKMEIWLKGTLEIASPDQINAEAEGNLTLVDEEEGYTSRTNVRISGDLIMDRKIPTTPAEAMAYIKDLPSITDTRKRNIDNNSDSVLSNDGWGVPMALTLTPLSWIDSKAAKLLHKLSDDALLRVIKIYESLEESEGIILDLYIIKYGGFTAWKVHLDEFYKKFQLERSTLALEIFAATSQFIKNGDFTAIAAIEEKYWSTANRFNKYSIISESREKENEILTLMALASQFSSAKITFAEKLSDFFAPTFDSTFDRVYALIIVGMNPANDRDAISKISDFVDLASANLIINDDEVREAAVKHCYKTTSGGKTECSETQAFVVIHFDSYCNDICDSQFCSSAEVSELCPTQSRISPCDYSPTVAENNECFANTYTGKCYIDIDTNETVPYNHTNAMMSPDHDIDNLSQPLSDCWCACPKTQIIEYVESRNPERLETKMPRVPKQPIISTITGYLKEDMELFGKSQVIELHVTKTDEDTLNWEVVLNYYVPKMTDGKFTYAAEKLVHTTRHSKARVVLSNLIAGQTYTVQVAGLNHVGRGRLSEKKSITVGHRLVDIHLIQGGVRTMTRDVPSWLSLTDVFFTLSTDSPVVIQKITIHKSFSSSNDVDNMIFTNDTDMEVYHELKCSKEDMTVNSATCTIWPDALINKDVAVEFRVWDITNLLIATNEITLVAPSPTTCKLYGTEHLFCPLSFEKSPDCVENCPTECNGSFLFGDTCTLSECNSTSIWCPSKGCIVKSVANPCEDCHDTAVHVTINSSDQCHIPGCSFKFDDTDTGDDAFHISDKFKVSFIDSRADEKIHANYILPSESKVEISCQKGYFNEGTNAEFTCPTQDDGVTQEIWAYDWNDIWNENNDSFRAKPKCTAVTSLAILLLLYHSLGGGLWSNNGNWFNSDYNYCAWYGITCTGDKHIGSISLDKNGLRGSIPSEIGLLNQLTSLNFNTNNLSGSIPSEIGQLTQLTLLALSFNHFSGSIPSEIGQLDHLEGLGFYDNKLSGSIPNEFEHLSQLVGLWFGNNPSITGTVPSALCGRGFDNQVPGRFIDGTQISIGCK